MSDANGAKIRAFVTAGAPLSADLAARTGTDLKALVPFDGEPLLSRILRTLRSVTEVGQIVVIGPKAQLEAVSREAGADDVREGVGDGAQNLFVGLEAHADEIGDGLILFVASDLPFLDDAAVRGFLSGMAGLPADILYPIVPRENFESAFPGVPKTYARLSEGEFTGGSVMLLRARSVLKNRGLLQKVFDARKSQLGMAQLLGWNFAIRYKLGRLTISEAEARASELTGCRCLAVRDADTRLAYDVDDMTDYEYAVNRMEATGGESR